ncbi:MAG: hypothetical protein KDD47_21620, partial [Acidobacteria bacterium]|nr:hypothetical protein [Acidobacteriota bacterium]
MTEGVDMSLEAIRRSALFASGLIVSLLGAMAPLEAAAPTPAEQAVLQGLARGEDVRAESEKLAAESAARGREQRPGVSRLALEMERGLESLERTADGEAFQAQALLLQEELARAEA